MRNDSNNDNDLAPANAVHAAGAWLQRIGAQLDAVAVVTVAPDAAVGVWRPGAAAVGMLAAVDEAGAELCEAVGPLFDQMLARVTEDSQAAVLQAVAAGAKLQVLIEPATGSADLRLMRGGQAVPLGTVTLPREIH